MSSINTIKDTRIRVKITSDLIDILNNNKSHLSKIPANVTDSFKKAGIQLSYNASTTEECELLKSPGIDIKLLNDILANSDIKADSDSKLNTRKEKKPPCPDKKSLEIYLYLNDLRWLSQTLDVLRSKSLVDVYLNDVLETCGLELPQNPIVERNPELEARCQRLREEQENREYRKMTKDVDATLKHYPEDTVAYQMKAMNSQIIAVLQFIFSVAAGFAFGFIGIELIIGNLDFGLRLLLGIMFALIIALAEIYFLAKKLNEYDNTVDTISKAIEKTTPKKQVTTSSEQAVKKMHVE